MSTMKIYRSDPTDSSHKRQKNWIRNEEKVKNWRKVSKRHTGKSTHKSGMSNSERKSDITRSGRLSDGTVHSNSTASSSESALRRLEDVDDLDQKESVEKCLKWVETLPQKFSGMHILVQPTMASGDIS